MINPHYTSDCLFNAYSMAKHIISTGTSILQSMFDNRNRAYYPRKHRQGLAAELITSKKSQSESLKTLERRD